MEIELLLVRLFLLVPLLLPLPVLLVQTSSKLMRLVTTRRVFTAPGTCVAW